MKKGILLMTLLFLSLCLFGCTAPKEKEGEKPLIVCTTFPQYDWIRNLLGEAAEAAELELLADSGVDLHSYQTSAADMVKIAEAGLFVYVGGTSESWVEAALKSSPSAARKELDLFSLLGERLYTEEYVEGMEREEEHAHEHGAESDYDEHVWLSVKNAILFCETLEEELCALLPAWRETIEKNAAAYLEALRMLDKDYEAMVQAFGRKTLLFADRFPFRYLTEDYGLSYYAAFPGCSADCDASFETLIFLAEKADAEEIPVLLILEGSDGRIAEAILANTKGPEREVLVLDAMQSVTKEAIQSGKSYLAAMEENRKVLQRALGGE